MPSLPRQPNLANNADFTDKLKQLLKKDIVDLEQLKLLLNSEKETLKTRNSSKIETIAQHKSQKVKQLELRAKLKAKLIASSGLEIKPGEVETTLNSLSDDELLSLWHQSRKMLQECKDSNLVNGNILNHSLQRTNKLMMIIRGQNKSQNLYGQEGKESCYSGSHRIGKA